MSACLTAGTCGETVSHLWSMRCIFTVETKLEVGQRIGLVNPKSGVEQPGTVTRVQKSRDGGYAVAFDFDSSTPQLWSLVFPPKDRKVERF